MYWIKNSVDFCLVFCFVIFYKKKSIALPSKVHSHNLGRSFGGYAATAYAIQELAPETRWHQHHMLRANSLIGL